MTVEKPVIWLNEFEAAKYVNRSRYTLRDWRISGIVIAKRRGELWWFDRQSLEHALATMRRNYTHRRIVPGTGRGRFRPVGLIPLWEDDGAVVKGSNFKTE